MARIVREAFNVSLAVSHSEAVARLNRMQVTCLPAPFVATRPETLQSRQVFLVMWLKHRIWLLRGEYSPIRDAGMVFLLSFKESWFITGMMGFWEFWSLAVPIFWGTERVKEFKGWSDKMGSGKEKQDRLAQSLQENSELLRGALKKRHRWGLGDFSRCSLA